MTRFMRKYTRPFKALFMISTVESNSVSPVNVSEMEIITTVHAFHAALIDADKESLESLLDERLSYGHSNGMIENKNQFIENILNGNSVFIEIELADQSVNILGDTSVVRHIFKAKTNDKNIPAAISLKVLLVWQKQNEQWKLLARQAVHI